MIKNKLNEQKYLLSSQYKSADNLKARIALHEKYGTSKIDFHDWLFEHIDIRDDAKILELGTGSARVWMQNKDRIPRAWQIILSDFSKGMIDEAKNNLSEIKREFSFKQIDIQNIPSEDNSFDMVMANHMLYHVPDVNKAVAEVERVLKPKGKLYAATNGDEHMLELKQFLLYADSLLPEDTVYIVDKKGFSLESGFALLKEYFQTIEVFPLDSEIVVDKAEPLLGYILSLVDLDRLEQTLSLAQQEKALKQILDFIENKLAKEPIKIRTRTGLFVAYKIP